VLYALVRRVLVVVFRVVWRPVIEGQEHIPSSGPVIVASNHLSFIDSIVIPLAVPNRQVTFLAKSEYFTGGGLIGLPRRAFFRAFGAVPVQRDDERGAQAALDTALELLRKGLAFGVYPEGTRSRDGRLYRGRVGIGWLALAAGAPVVPVGLTGTDRVQPVGARIPRVHRVHVRFGPPIRAEDYAAISPTSQARRQLTDDVMDVIAKLSGQERAPGYNERPPED
jgi:1-acyl-sn-glycerol-3-phosphate acyltransferase